MVICLDSGARCKLFAYSPADATAIPKPHHLQTGFTFLVLAYPGYPGKEAIKRVMGVVVVVCRLMDQLTDGSQ